jgi:uncharacterized protein YyaL (SSP411 family)
LLTLITETQLDLFWDSAASGFFSTQASQSDLLLRLKDGFDNAEPSANGRSARNLFRLAALLGDEDYADRARRTCEAFEAELMQHPFLFAGMLDSVVATRLGTRCVTICSGQSEGEEGKKVDEVIKRERQRGSGLATLAVNQLNAAKDSWLKQRNSLLKHMDGKKNVLLICEGTSCREVALDADIAKETQVA